ncbi:hypothetical protein [Actinacidiphila sp. bgisy167]|uniref:hypothetical protein n=1 Tax=Actinacidiphila sp. bgisy167 TaxID=3413797 RepID=UPI003D75A53E
MNHITRRAPERTEGSTTLSRKAGKLASAAALGIAVATMTVGTTPAYADQGSGRLVNDYVYTYPTDTICIDEELSQRAVLPQRDR